MNDMQKYPGPPAYWTAVMTVLLLLPSLLPAQVELRYQENITPSWPETIDMYRWLDSCYEDGILMEVGSTDAGKPLHAFIIDTDRDFHPHRARERGKSILFINNGIHPGEPCGVDASLKLASELLSGEESYHEFLDHTVLVLIPLLNVGGALNRSPFHRANQNGPREHGFRGNARNLDLNRDFIKLDSRNTRSLVRLIRFWDPHIFVDTHTSNGADYPYTLTLINSHAQRHEAVQARFLDSLLLPELYRGMEKSPYDMCPYVWSYRQTPEQGILAFMDYPRYTSGYVSLYNSFAFTLETHMFKPYADRVLSTWHLLRELLKFSSTYAAELERVKKQADQDKLERKEFVLEWALDTSRQVPIPFRGYQVKYRKSQVSGQDLYYFDRNSIWEKEIPYYKFFLPVTTVQAPSYYILPSAWGEVVDRLKFNGVEMEVFDSDTLLEVDAYYIDSLQSASRPYNGHFRHSQVRVREEKCQIWVRGGDYKIPLRQKAREYLIQTLEPQAYDSFFSWNFFDEILFRNEYFSPYIFDATAAQLLQEDPALRRSFEKRKKDDPDFAKNTYRQLRFIYENSPWSEATYMRYPVYRLRD